MLVFETSAFNHSATPPYYITGYYHYCFKNRSDIIHAVVFIILIFYINIMCGDKNMCGGGACGAGTCGNGGGFAGHGHHHKFMKKVLFMLVIITLTFWMGVKFGEMSGMIRAYKGDAGWNRGGMMSQKWGQQNGWTSETSGATTPTAPDAPANK
jgi:hypothetical protein